jgi:hypothetical protein
MCPTQLENSRGAYVTTAGNALSLIHCEKTGEDSRFAKQTTSPKNLNYSPFDIVVMQLHFLSLVQIGWSYFPFILARPLTAFFKVSEAPTRQTT